MFAFISWYCVSNCFTHQTGPKWLPLQMVASGELLLSVNELIPTIVSGSCDTVDDVCNQYINIMGINGSVYLIAQKFLEPEIS